MSFVARHELSRGRRLRQLMRFLAWQVGARVVPGPIAVTLVDDTMLLAQPGLRSATGVVYVGLPEFETMAFVLHALGRGDTLADVGANVGVFTLLATAVGGRVVAFEPDAEARSWLVRNVQLNGCTDRVQVIDAAVGRQCGSIRLTRGLDSMNRVVLPGSAAAADAPRTQDVPLVSLDATFAGKASPHLVKIDVEGFESEVIDGGERTLRDPAVAAVVMELVGEGRRYGADEREIAGRMESWGYQRCHYDPLGRALHVIADPSVRPGNVIFVRDPQTMNARLASAPRVRVMGREF